MYITSYTQFRQNLKSFMDKVFASRSPLFISRSNGEDMVMISKSDYESMQETLHLMSSPENARRLKEGMEQYKQGNTISIASEDLDSYE